MSKGLASYFGQMYREEAEAAEREKVAQELDKLSTEELQAIFNDLVKMVEDEKGGKRLPKQEDSGFDPNTPEFLQKAAEVDAVGRAMAREMTKAEDKFSPLSKQLGLGAALLGGGLGGAVGVRAGWMSPLAGGLTGAALGALGGGVLGGALGRVISPPAVPAPTLAYAAPQQVPAYSAPEYFHSMMPEQWDSIYETDPGVLQAAAQYSRGGTNYNHPEIDAAVYRAAAERFGATKKQASVIPLTTYAAVLGS